MALGSKTLICSLHSSRLNYPPVDSFSNDAPQPSSEASVLRAWVGLSVRIGLSLLIMLFFHHVNSFLQESIKSVSKSVKSVKVS